MKRNFAFSLALRAVAACLAVLPASAGTIFSDLGPVGDVYNKDVGWTIAGKGAFGTSFTDANLFTAAIGGSVSQVDLAVAYVTGVKTFYASIWTDVNNLPGTQVPGARWNNLAGNTFGACCKLVAINVSGVSLTGGSSYFMVLGPMNINDNSANAWNQDTIGVTGLLLQSNDGGVTWNSFPGETLGTFAIFTGTSVPEPSSLLLLALGTGLVGALRAARRNIAR